MENKNNQTTEKSENKNKKIIKIRKISFLQKSNVKMLKEKYEDI